MWCSFFSIATSSPEPFLLLFWIKTAPPDLQILSIQFKTLQVSPQFFQDGVFQTLFSFFLFCFFLYFSFLLFFCITFSIEIPREEKQFTKKNFRTLHLSILKSIDSMIFGSTVGFCILCLHSLNVKWMKIPHKNNFR